MREKNKDEVMSEDGRRKTELFSHFRKWWSTPNCVCVYPKKMLKRMRERERERTELNIWKSVEVLVKAYNYKAQTPKGLQGIIDRLLDPSIFLQEVTYHRNKYRGRDAFYKS